MSKLTVKEAAEKILTKSMTTEEACEHIETQELPELELLIKKVKGKLVKQGMPGYMDPGTGDQLAQSEKKVGKVTDLMDKDIYEERGKHNPVMESPANKSEMLKYNAGGQWSIEKAIKPGPTLDYSKMNPKPNYAEIESKAPTIDYSKVNAPNAAKPKWKENSSPASTKETWMKMNRMKREKTIAAEKRGIKPEKA
jgi:hypothetical protein